MNLPSPRPIGLVLATFGTWVSALTFVGIAVASLLQWHGRFSIGVAVVLVLYAALLAWIGLLGWNGKSYARGLLVASALLHLGVVYGSEREGSIILWLLAALVPALVLVCALLPSTSRALGIETRSR